ncbi:MAG: hypothetical protein AAB583_02020 [Patescibacteria group bacterium]
MFERKKSILFITKSKIKIVSVVFGKIPRENVIAESDWNFDNLLSFILQYKKSIGNYARLLISEDFVYVITLSFPQEAVLDRDVIRKRAQEFIPEDLNKTIWYFKEVSNRKTLVVAAVKELFEDISEIITKSEVRIETIEPLSLSLARLTQKQAPPILFIYLYDKAYLTFAQKEAVFATERLDLPLTLGKVKKFILFTKENFEIGPKEIVFCGNTDALNLQEYEKENFRTQIQQLSPTISLAYKEDTKDKDKKELNLELIRTFSPSPSLKIVSPKKNKLPVFWIVSIIFLIIIIALEVLLYFRFDLKLMQK